MLALRYHPSVGRHVAARASRRAGLGSLELTELAPPRAPAADWTQVRPRLSGICGSDLALFTGRASAHLGALTSSPFTPGHEVVGELSDGRRVVIEPALGCTARGLHPACPECTTGRHALCRQVSDGDVSAGLQIGFCRDTGGGWGEALVAHRSQVHPIPATLPDEDAVLIEPLACALHAVRLAGPLPGQRLVVIGAGTIGLLTVAALRALAPEVTVLCVAKHSGQQHEAVRLGADATCVPDRLALEAARVTRSRRLVDRLGGELLLGGVDCVLDCVGSSASLQAAVTITRPQGMIVLVGMPGRVSLDLSLAWQRELRVQGAYGYYHEFAEAITWAGRLGLGRLVDRAFGLRDFRTALEHAPRAARSGATKTVFDLRAP